MPYVVAIGPARRGVSTRTTAILRPFTHSSPTRPLAFLFGWRVGKQNAVPWSSFRHCCLAPGNGAAVGARRLWAYVEVPLKLKNVLGAGLGSLALTTGTMAIGATGPAGAATSWSSASSAAAGGGFSALVAAAKKEGNLTVITLPANWANYGTIMKDFTKKYGIKIKDVNPEGSSQDELNAITQLKTNGPDVVDVGTAYALAGASSGLFAPYKVQDWNQIPSNAKASNGDWFYDYGGYISIGYNTADVTKPITSFADLSQPSLKGAVALDGNPVGANAAFSAVYAAALANGGSLGNITPGLTFFANLAKTGNFNPVQSSPALVESGQIKAIIDWDYLNVATGLALKAQGINWKVIIPKGVNYAGYYVQAVSKYAPHPAAARLWEEYLYSTTGQNLWLQGYARPILLPSLVKAGTVDKSAYKALPPAAGAQILPTTTELNAAKNQVQAQWPGITG